MVKTKEESLKRESHIFCLCHCSSYLFCWSKLILSHDVILQSTTLVLKRLRNEVLSFILIDAPSRLDFLT